MNPLVSGVTVAMLLCAGMVWAGETGSLILDRCVGCHDLEKTCLVETNDEPWWDATILRMVEYQSDLLEAEEVGRVRQFLVDEEKRKALCP